MPNMPKYIEVYRMIKNDIRDGVYQLNDFLPNEGDLEKKYNVSRTTVRSAIDLLRNDGIVEVMQGRGTQVCHKQTTQIYNRVTSFTETLKKRGFEVTNKNMSIEIIEANEQLSDELELTPGDNVARVQRLQLADGEPIAIMTNFMPYRFVPEIEKYAGTFIALYQFIEKTYGISVENTLDRVTATNSTFLEAQTLNIKPGDALINVRRICYSKGIAVSVDFLNIIGTKYTVELTTRERLKL